LIEPGRPWHNGVAESFNVKFRDEGLSLNGAAATRTQLEEREDEPEEKQNEGPRARV